MSVLEWLLGKRVVALLDGLAAGLARAEKEKMSCCDIPERDCPPRVAGEIRWAFARGALPEATVVVRNTGRVARPFAFSVTPLAGAGAGQARLAVQPAHAIIEPGKQQIVTLKLLDSAALRPGQEYYAELSFLGSWEQCLRVTACVAPDPVVHLELSDGTCKNGERARGVAGKSDSASGAVRWTIERGVVPEADVRVHNAGREARTFALHAEALSGRNAGSSRLVVAPTSLELGPGQSGTARLQLVGSEGLEPCQHYLSKLRVTGADEHPVSVECQVRRDPTVHAHVEQGEPPVRVRALHWYRHFQCTEPCAGPAPNQRPAP